MDLSTDNAAHNFFIITWFAYNLVVVWAFWQIGQRLSALEAGTRPTEPRPANPTPKLGPIEDDEAA